jgi:hypothetical protein
MTDRLTSQFYRAEADRLLQLAVLTRELPERIRLMEVASQFRQMAARVEASQQAAGVASADPGPGTKSA